MDIVHVRIDDRLIHGQVTIGWSKVVRPTHIVVANDPAAANPLTRGVLQMVPIAGVKIAVLTLAEFQQYAAQPGADRVFLIVASPIDLVALVDAGVEVPAQVIVGNIGYRAGRQRISKEVYANEAEIAALRLLAAHGIALTAQWTPNSPTVDLNHELARVAGA